MSGCAFTEHVAIQPQCAERSKIELFIRFGRAVEHFRTGWTH